MAALYFALQNGLASAYCFPRSIYFVMNLDNNCTFRGSDIFYPWTDFPGGFGGGGGFKPPQGWVNTPPENVETPPKKLETPPEILLIFNIPNYSLDYFTTMKLF